MQTGHHGSGRLALALLTLNLGLLFAASASDRINHEGRILPPTPPLNVPVLFNTPEADAVLASIQVFPADNPWNEDISRRPVLANSDAMIARIISDLGTSRRTLRLFQEMNFVLVPDGQPLIPIAFVDYPDESDPGPWPIPPNMPIETWPSQTGGLTLEDWQRDLTGIGGDRHSIVVQPGTGGLWETWQAKRVGTNWQASNGARFDLGNNALRPAGWTSGDAAGLPMFPALVRYDEAERGAVEHACRLVVARTRREYLYPARHYASTIVATQTNVPAMGQRLRLKAGFIIPENWSKAEQAVLRALKKYGAIVADNGNFFSISITPDDRWPADAFSNISSVSITNFEVVVSTGPAEGPRSPGPPTADAGPDQVALPGQGVSLQGAVTAGSAPLASVRWRACSGPGPVNIVNPERAETAAVFGFPGEYTLMLSADDGVHAVAFDTLRVSVGAAAPPQLAVALQNSQIFVSWPVADATNQFALEATDTLAPTNWATVVQEANSPIALPLSSRARFFRLVSPSGSAPAGF